MTKNREKKKRAKKRKRHNHAANDADGNSNNNTKSTSRDVSESGLIHAAKLSRGVDVLMDTWSTLPSDTIPACIHGPGLLFERFLEDGGSQRYFACAAYRSRTECPLFVPQNECGGKQATSNFEESGGGGGGGGGNAAVAAAITTETRAASAAVTSESTCNDKHIPLGLSSPQRVDPPLVVQIMAQKKASKRLFCLSCQTLVAPTPAARNAHTLARGHECIIGLSRVQLMSPTRLLVPAADSQRNAQILFDSDSVSLLLGLLDSLGVKRVLCVGVPRVHEAIQLARW
eukprot:UC1_evm4s358